MADIHYRVDKQECTNCSTIWFSSIYNPCPECGADVHQISKTSGISFKEIDRMLDGVDFK